MQTTIRRLALTIAFAAAAAGSPLLAAEFHLDQAIDQLESHTLDLMQQTGIPGLAIAVVHGGEIVYTKGFGVRVAGEDAPVDPDTVFQLASMSKPIGATVIAHQVGAGVVHWNDLVRTYLPDFALGNDYVTENLTIGDLYAHRSGLPDHAGDPLEELGYSQEEIFARMDQLPLTPFRDSFAYTNYGMTAAAMAVAKASGTDWATLSEETLYTPLGMDNTSSRFGDFEARSNRALGHVKENGSFVLGPERDFEGQQHWSSGYNTDRQQPSGGVSSTANDIARWMLFLLANGKFPDGSAIPAEALWPAVTPKTTIYQSKGPGEHMSSYGYGFFVNNPEGQAFSYNHGGAFAWGASTYFTVIPAADVGIVVLTNAWPTGVPEAIVMQFTDILQFGAPKQDWFAVYSSAMAGAFTPQGELAGLSPPAAASLAKSLDAYVGTYRNPYLGEATIVLEGEELVMHIGAGQQLSFPLRHWDGDVFAFDPLNDAAPPGSVSKAEFTDGGLRLEHYDHNGLGYFEKD